MASVALAIFLVFLGCGANVFFLEHLIKIDSSSGHLITFGQFLFISLERLCHFRYSDGFKIPLSRHLLLVALFVSVSVINNWSFSFSIPLTLHIVFRAGSLVSNCALSRILLKKKFSTTKYLSVFVITSGIFICTFMTAKAKSSADSSSSIASPQIVTGLIVLSVALFLSSFIGIIQEKTRSEYGKHPMECLFLHHFLSLPMFYFLSGPIGTSMQNFSASEIYETGLPLIENVPIAWLYLLGNIMTQYICIRSIFVLTTECTSLTVTLVITLRKFFSLLISVVYFNSIWTQWHWLGTALVFGGTFLYADISLFSTPKKKEE